MIESFSDFVRRRRPICDRCGAVRNGGNWKCECVTGKPPTLVPPSDEDLQREFNGMVSLALGEQTTKERLMFDIIGIFVVWFIGAIVSFYGPLVAGMAWRGGLETIAVGYLAARVCCAFYLLATVVFFIVT